MKEYFFAVLLLAVLGAAAQEQRNGKWYDDNLQLVVIAEDLAGDGSLTWCIEQKDRGECVENLATAFELIIYDAQGKQLVKSIWVKNQKTIVLKSAQPKAHRVVMRATHPSVVNTLTGTRIYQTKPLELEFVLR
jgi:hypothetical protein